jgi:MFS family permease
MLQLIRQYPQLLIFGILTAAFSGPGQTFLVSLFIPAMRETFQYSQTEVSGIYAAATLCSALILPLMGRLLDRVHLLKFTLMAGFIVTCGCLCLSFSTGLFTIFFGFLLVRNMGQGGMSLISSTTMARVFGTRRGKALGIANLGYPLSEAIFPLLITAWIFAHGWRSGWLLLAGLMVLFFSPVVALLLWNKPHEKVVNEVEVAVHEVTHIALHNVIRDWKFYALQIPALIPACFLTALFFHQGSLMSWKGWDLQVIAAGFIVFAIGRGAMSFLIGPIIDRYSACRAYPYYLLPFAGGVLCLLFGQHIGWSFGYLLGVGMTLGLAFTLNGALWAELYGTAHLGSIKGLQFSFLVLSTAVTPLLAGYLLDQGVSFDTMLWWQIGVIIFGTLLSKLVCDTISLPSVTESE